MVINPDTMRGIPIGHYLAARSTASDLKEALNFFKGKVPDWTPRLVIVDKDLTEHNGISMFATQWGIQLIIFLCYFHVKQAIDRWMKLSVNHVPVLLRDTVQSSVAAMHFANTEAEFTTLKSEFLSWADVKHKGLAAYFRKEWFSVRFNKMWSRAFVTQIGDYVTFVNNYIESWHKLLKSIALGNKHNRRLDHLLYVLVVLMEKLLHRALHGYNLSKLRQKMTPIVNLAFENIDNALPDHEFSDVPDGKCAVSVGAETYFVNLRGQEGWNDGPHCSCESAETMLCIHIIICVLANNYSFDELKGFGFAGSQTDMLYKTLRASPEMVELQEFSHDSESDVAVGIEAKSTAGSVSSHMRCLVANLFYYSCPAVSLSLACR